MDTFVLLAAQGGGGAGGGTFLIMMLVIFAIMWFFMIRPQQKKQKEVRNYQNSLQEGAKVVIGNGIYGEVERIDPTDNTVHVRVAKGVVIRVDRACIFADATAAANGAANQPK